MRGPKKLMRPLNQYLGSGTAPDGRVVELARDHRDGLARLLMFDPKTNTVSDRFAFSMGEKAFWPIDGPEEWIRAVRLPEWNSDLRMTLTLDQCFDRIRSVFTPLGEGQAVLLASWALSTWQIEKSPVPPLLFVAGTHASAVLAALDPVCRRSIVLCSDFGSGNFPGELQPTLLVSLPTPRVAQHFLGESVSPNQLTWKGGRLVKRYTPRAAGYSDDAKPLRGVLNIGADAPVDAGDVLAGLQQELFAWRLLTWNQKADLKEVAGDPVLENLLVGVAPNEALMTRVMAAYQRHLESLKEEFASEEDTAVKAALAEIAKQVRPSIRVGEIAEKAEKHLRATGSYLGITARRAGEVLRKLGFETGRLGSSGRGLTLNAENRARIKELGSQEGQSFSSETPDLDAAQD